MLNITTAIAKFLLHVGAVFTKIPDFLSHKTVLLSIGTVELLKSTESFKRFDRDALNYQNSANIFGYILLLTISKNKKNLQFHGYS